MLQAGNARTNGGVCFRVGGFRFPAQEGSALQTRAYAAQAESLHVHLFARSMHLDRTTLPSKRGGGSYGAAR